MENINKPSILGSIIRDLRQEKKAIVVGMVTYFLSLSIVFIIVIGMIYHLKIAILYPFPFNLIITEIIFALPAIPSAFITNYLSKRNSDGIYVVIISGILVIVLISSILGVLVFIELTGPPPVNEWARFGRYMPILLIFYLYLFFILPVGVISTFFASVSSTYGNKLLLSQTK
ncbi:MAG: hypothetical protein JSW11_22685 [Candidatus Heimdallarchaeota archaeon]|nr:MAG: hypothetical protein JSW11_22685 [Candidatus Heimdallarchaeota archaeon]